MSHSNRTASKSFAALALLLGALLAPPVGAQSSADTDKDGKISDAERARRDADKVYSFIKFHTVRPAAAAAPRPSPRPAVAPVAPVAAAAAAPAVSRALSAPAPSPNVAAAAVPTPVAPSVAAAPASEQPAAAAPAQAVAAMAPASAELQSPIASLPPTPLPQAPVTQPVVEPEPAPEEEVPLKLIAYVAPEMNAQVLAAMTSLQVAVPVRFVVQPDGLVSSAVVRGNVPRKVGQAAVRAVQQWRFDKIPAQREIDVEIVFKTSE